MKGNETVGIFSSQEVYQKFMLFSKIKASSHVGNAGILLLLLLLLLFT
jgi:hypothetical protein